LENGGNQMAKSGRISTKNFVVNCNWDIDELKVWFVRHPKLDGNKPMMVGKGGLEEYLLKMRKELMGGKQNG
jgi:hypothetical protein